ncbi:MAG: T9SS type A sorting domain-containing protein [Bacteroidota bacterium]|nr:T9SS type A sorting domain-containing protein [Bacteroidota bacterium]
MYENYGPGGTDELVILWAEIDSSTGIDDIEGNTSSTQGDWTNGGIFPVPIIDNSSMSNYFGELYGGGVPSVFMACPSGYYKDVTGEAWTSAAAVYNTIGSCPTENNDIELTSISSTNSVTGCALGTEESVIVELTNIGTDNVSDIEVSYTLEGATTITETVAGPIAPMETYTYTFTATEDFSVIASYAIEASVIWPEDEDLSNNTKEGAIISGDSELTVDLTTDNYPQETSWDIVDNTTGFTIASSPEYDNSGNYVETFCILSTSCYTFTIYDAYGDGICCSYGNGSYTISVDGNEVGSGGSFGNSESVDIDAQVPEFDDVNVCVGETIDWDMDYPGEFSLLPADIDNMTVGQTTVNYLINEATECEAYSSFIVNVVDNTIDIAGDDIFVCQGETINLPAGNGIFSPETIDNSVVGTTTVTYTINEGMTCEGSTTFDVTVFALPDVDITCEDQEYCLGETIELPVGAGSFEPATVDNAVGGTTNINYTTASSPESCVNTCDFTVTVYDNVIDIEPENITVCEGEPIVFPTGAGVFDPTSVDNQTAGTTTVTYYMAIDTDCEESTTFDVTVLEVPEATITQVGFDLSTDATGNIQWYLDDDVIDGATEASYSCTVDGDYYIIVTFDNNCESQSNTITVTGTDVENYAANQFRIYPNPNSGILKIDNAEGAQIQIINQLGQIVASSNIDDDAKELNLSDFPNGTYIVKIIHNDIVSTSKILLSK